jgi:hypothetical protein
MKKTYIILLNYNGWGDTQECLESVLKLDYPNYQIIVVDNNSPNDSMSHLLAWAKGEELATVDNPELAYLSNPLSTKPVEFVLYDKATALAGGDASQEAQFSNPIIFIQAGENNGFSAGNNIGIQYALSKNDFEYVWLLNNDTVVENNSLTMLFSYAEQNVIGICGSALMYYNEPKKVQAYGGTINKFFGTSKHILDKLDIERKLDYVVGASFLINKKVIDEIGLMPEDYFLYYEETDYCFNSKNNGFKLGIATESVVFHKEGSSTGGSTDSHAKSEFSDVLGLKNRIKFHRKYLGGGIGLWSGMVIAFYNRIKRRQFQRIWKVFR